MQILMAERDALLKPLLHVLGRESTSYGTTEHLRRAISKVLEKTLTLTPIGGCQLEQWTIEPISIDSTLTIPEAEEAEPGFRRRNIKQPIPRLIHLICQQERAPPRIQT